MLTLVLPVRGGPDHVSRCEEVPVWPEDLLTTDVADARFRDGLIMTSSRLLRLRLRFLNERPTGSWTTGRALREGLASLEELGSALATDSLELGGVETKHPLCQALRDDSGHARFTTEFALVLTGLWDDRPRRGTCQQA